MASGYRLGLAYVQIVPSMKGVGRSIVDAFEKQQGAEENVGKSMGRHIAEGLKSATSSVASSMKQLSEPVRQVSRDMAHMPKGEAMQSMAHAARTATTAIKDESLSINESTEKIHSLRSTVHDAAQAYSSANKDVRSALRGVNTATGDVQRAIKRYGSDSIQARNAVQRLSEAQSRYADAAHRAETANSNLRESQSKLSAATSGFRGHLAAMRDSLSSFAHRLRDSSGFSAFISHAEKAGHSGESMGQRIKAGTIAVGSAIGNMVSNAVSQFGDFARSCISTYSSASQGIARFNQVASNNHWSDAQKTSLDSLASSLQHVGVLSAATTRAGETQLGMMRMSTGAIHQLTPAMDDMVVGMRGIHASAGDATQVARLLGRAVNGSTGALGRFGIVMTKAQKATFSKANTDRRAAMLAQMLEQRYGGVNRALAQTPAGKIQQLQNNFAVLKATLGNSFMQTIGAVAPAITDMINKSQKPVANFAKWMTSAISGIAHAIRTGNISSALKRAFGAVNAKSIVNGINAIKRGFKDAFSGITRGLRNLSGDMSRSSRQVNPFAKAFELLGHVIEQAGKVIQRFGPYLKQILIAATIALAIGKLVASMEKLKSAFGDTVRLITAIIHHPLVAVIVLVVAAIGFLIVKAVQAEKKFHWVEKVGKWFQNLGKTIQKVAGNIGKWFQKTFSGLGKDFQKFGKDTQKNFRNAAKGAQKAWSGTQKWFQKLGNNIGKSWNGFKRNTSRAFKSAQKGAQSAWNRTPSWFRSSIVGKIISAYARMPGRIIQFFRHPAQSARSIWNGVRGWFHGLPGHIAGFFGVIPGRIRGFFQRAGSGARSIWQGVSGWFQGLPGRIAGFFESIPGRIRGFFARAGEGVRSVWNGVMGWFRGLPGRIAGFFESLPGRLIDIGRNMVEGLINGIRSNIGRVAQVITGGMKSAISSVKSFLGIHSPSTVMRDEIGQWVGKGMAVGIKSSMRDVQDSMDRLASIPADTKIRPLDASNLVTNLPTSGIAAPTFTGRIAPIYLANRQPYKPSVTQHVNVYTDHDDLYTVAPILYRSTRNEVIH